MSRLCEWTSSAFLKVMARLMTMATVVMTLALTLTMTMTMMTGTAKAGIIRDTEIEDALLRIIRPMSESAGLNPDMMEVRVVINNQYNAFVMGDNMIYMHSGLITSADSMLEVAGVLAHEIGHIAAGHIPRRGEVIENANMASILSAVAAIALSASGAGDAAFGVLAGGVDRSQRIVLARSRQDEGVADEIAIELMEEHELSLKPMAEAMRKLGAQRVLPQSRQSDYYLTHPGAQERSAVFQDHINNHETEPRDEPQWMKALHQRITTKLLAWTNPPKTTLANNFGDYSPAATYQRAIALYRLSDVDSAENEMRILLDEVPNDPYYHEFLGDVLMAKGEAAAAVDAYKTAISLMETGLNKGQIFLSMGRALMIKGDDASLNEAIVILEQAVQDEPEWAFVKHQLGIAYGKVGRLADADLILAEEALLVGNTELATRLAKRVSTHDDASAIHKRLAADILLQSGS
ncbi:MAG: M48 family metalloprotease [Alphaproteobacteria bacterium]|nr:M48 family metalloprotease [Alphaproteobacteria bacterium]